MKNEITKETLIAENAKLKQSHEGWVAGDERRRKEFAKAFSWLTDRNPYDRTQEVQTPSWEQIFTQVGRLLAAQDLYDIKRKIEELDHSNNELWKKLNDTATNEPLG